MKRTLYLASLVFALLALYSCEKDVITQDLAQQKDVVLSFVSEKPSLSDDPDTRTVWKEDASTIYWGKGDKIRVAIKVGENWQAAEGNADPEATPAKFAKLYVSEGAEEEARTVSFKVPAYFTTTTSGLYSFYAFYPHDLRNSTDADIHMPSVSITIPDEQTPPSNSFDPSADVLTAVSVGEFNGIPTDREVPLRWTRQVAHGLITLKKIPAFESDEVVRSIKIEAQEGADLAGYHYLDMVTGAITLPNNATPKNSITILSNNGSIAKNSDGNIVFWFSSLPFTATSLKVVLTTNKSVYTKEYTDITRSFLKNSRNILGISMSNCDVAPVTDNRPIADGTYVVSTTYEGNDLMMVANTGSGNYQNYAALSTEIEDGKIVVSPSQAWVFTYDSNNGCYYISNYGTGTYLSGTTGNSNSNLVLTSSEYKTKFTISEEGTGYHILTPGSNPRWIGYNHNGGSGRFALYRDDSQYPGIVLISPAKVNVTTVATPSFNPAAGTYTSAQNVTISCTTEGATIYYTTDGSDPTNSSTQYSTAIPISTTTTLKAIAIKDNVSSDVASASYIITSGDNLVYTLTPTGGSNNGYANNCDIEIDGITWNLTGNSQTLPWRIGGKSLSGVDRTLYSKTALNGSINKIEITHGAASSITVNSMTVVVASDANFDTIVSTLTPTFSANSTITINRPDGVNWDNCYYKIVYNVTVSGTSNKFLEFSNAKFYGVGGSSGDTNPGISVTTNDAENIVSTNGTTATLKGSISLNNGATLGNITEAGFYYKLTSLNTPTKVTCASVSSDTFSYDLIGLTTDAEYSFYAYAKYNDGNEEIGETKSFIPTQQGSNKGPSLSLSLSDLKALSWSNGTATTNGYTISISNGSFTSSESIRIYSGASITISRTDGKLIETVVVTSVNNGTQEYGPQCLSGTGYTASTGKTGTWTGSSSTVSLNANKQFRLTALSIN